MDRHTPTCVEAQGQRVAHRSRMVYGSRGRSGCLPSGAWNNFARLASSAPREEHTHQPRLSSKARSSSSMGDAKALLQHSKRHSIKQTFSLV